MEKLELKYYTPYLEHGVKIYEYREDLRDLQYKYFYIGEMSLNADCTNPKNFSNGYMLALRPKSDLFKQIEYRGEMITPCHYLAKLALNTKNFLLDIQSNKYHYHTLIYNLECQDFLNELHFDWRYNLIEKGLAIDINTLEQ